MTRATNIFGTNPKRHSSAGSLQPMHPASCSWPKWYGFHDGLGLAEGFPEVARAVKASEIFGTNPKSV